MTALCRSTSRSIQQAAISSTTNGALSFVDDSVPLDDQYTLGAVKKGLKKLRDQLDQDVVMKGK